MDEKDDIEFIDENVSEKEEEYVWKKKKALQNKPSKSDNAEYFVTLEDLADDCSDFSNCENSLSPKAPLFVQQISPNSKSKSVLKHDFDFTDDITIKVSFKNDKLSIELGDESSDSVGGQKSGIGDSFARHTKFESSSDAQNNVLPEVVTKKDFSCDDGMATKDAETISVSFSNKQNVEMVNMNDSSPLIKKESSSKNEEIPLVSWVGENINTKGISQTSNFTKENEIFSELEPENYNDQESKRNEPEGRSEIFSDNIENNLSKQLLVSDNETVNYQNVEKSDIQCASDSAAGEDTKRFTHQSGTAYLERIINVEYDGEKNKVNNGDSQYENSLKVLTAFRNSLIPGITAATNWIDSCDQFTEDDIGVTSFVSTLNYDNENCEVKETSKYKVEGESRYGGSVECRRTTVSTGAAKPTLNGADTVSRFSNNETRHILPSCRHNCNNENSDHICESVSLPLTAGCHIVVEPKFVDQEIQVTNSFYSNCELRLLDKNSIDSTECVLSGENGTESDNYNCVCNGGKIYNVNRSVAENKNTGKHKQVSQEKSELTEFDNKNIETFIKGKYLNDTLNSKACKKELKCVKDLPLIFPRLNIPKINDVGETIRLNKCDADAATSEPNNNFQLAHDNGLNSDDNENAEVDNIEKKESEERNKDQEKNETCIVRYVNDSVMNFDEMKQKKKTEEHRNKKVGSDEQIYNTSGVSVEYCDGHTNQNMLKSALKRGTTSKKSKKKNRVQFDESLNKFFDADYVILIREEFDECEGECGLSVCNCGDQYCYEDCCEESEDDEDDYTVQEIPSSPKFDLCTAFEPPMEFVDQVTLSPPDGYKDISHSCCSHRHHHHHVHINQQDPRRQHDENGEWLAEEQKMSDVEEENVRVDEPPEEEQFTGSINQADTSSHSQQQIPVQQQQRYIVETITMTTVTERRIVREADDHQVHKQPSSDVQEEGKLSGILKGGKLWKSTDSCNQTDFDDDVNKSAESNEQTEDEDNKRSVRFNESKEETRTKDVGIETDGEKLNAENGTELNAENGTELNLTFKVGNHLLISSNSNKPNSAVRQLFPSSKFILKNSPSDECNDENKYLLTAESLKLFEETKKSKLLQYYNKDTSTLKSPQENDEDEDDDSLKNNLIKRTIERNTLRRSLLKYPNDIKFRKKPNKVENSLVERIKQLTCDVDEGNDDTTIDKSKDDGEQIRINPAGEESQKRFDKITTSTYKKFTDLFSRRDKLEAVHPSVLTTPVPIQHQYSYYKPVYNQTSPPDLGNGSNVITKNVISRNSVTTEARKQFLSSLAPLTACVSGNSEDAPTNKDAALNVPGERSSVASTSTAATEYSINDIDEVLNNDEVKTGQKPPDVLCGTPAGNTEQDELALFVQQDAGRIERIKQRYNAVQNNSDDDENDDYGFNRRPSVRGIKPRFGSTTEILQQMQSQLQPPPLACSSRAGSHITWPCYTPDSTRNRTEPRSVMPMMKDDDAYNYIPCANYDHESNDTRLSYQQQVLYSTNLHQPMRIPGGGDFIYQRQLHHPIHTDSPPRTSPVGSMMIPYQNDNQEYYPRQTAPIYARRSMPANILQMRVTSQPIRFPQYIESEPHYSTQPLQSASIIRLGHQQTIRVPYPTSGPVQVHLLATRRSESPQRAVNQSVGYQTNQYVVARGTQTSMYYQNQPRAGPYYHQTIQQNGPNYNNRTLLYGDSVTKPTSLQYNNNYPLNTNRPASPIPSLTSSPTRMKPQVERGVPEGAASTSPGFPQDSLYHLSQSTNIPSPSQDVADSTTSPIVPVQPITSSTAPSTSSVFYSMNV